MCKELHVTEKRILHLEHTDVEDEQEDDQDAYSLELLVVLAIDDGVGLALLQLGRSSLSACSASLVLSTEYTVHCQPEPTVGTSAR